MKIDWLNLIIGALLGWAVSYYFYKKAKKDLANTKTWLKTFNDREIKPFEDKANYYKNDYPAVEPTIHTRRNFEDIQSMAHNSYERITEILKNIKI